MAYETGTILDLPIVTDLQDTDKIYLVRGVGVGRDKQAAANVIQNYIGDTVVEVTATGTVDLSIYFTNLVVKCNPGAGITLTITNELPDGKELKLFNISAFTVSLVIEGDTFDVKAGFYVKYLSDGTNMVRLNQIAGDLVIDGDVTAIETTELKITDKAIDINVGGTTAGTLSAGVNFIGDAGAIVGGVNVGSAGTSLLTLKAPTGNILTIDCNADKELEMSANLAVNGDTVISNAFNVTADCTIDQDLATTVSVQFLDAELYRADSFDTAIRCTNITTGMGSSNGTIFGIDGDENARIYNNEDTDMFFATNSLERLRIKNDGRLSTGAESAPDVLPGGLTLNIGTNPVGAIQTIKQSNVAHGITNVVETDTFFAIQMINTDLGGVQFVGLNESTEGIASIGIGTTVDVSESTSSEGAMRVDGAKKSGTAFTTMGTDENAIILSSGLTTRWIMKGNGQIYNDYATAMTLYDDENDIEIGRALQQKIGGIKISKNMTEKLQNLGILNKEGFACQQTLTALQLGISSQLSNMIRHFAKHIGITENQLLEWSKNYS